MSWITITWSMAVSACLTIAVINLVIWLQQSDQRAHFLFSVTATAVAAIAALELLQMHAQSSGQSGMGMGLAIARSIVTSHGGELAAANAQGGGACVHFTLPVLAEGSER